MKLTRNTCEKGREEEMVQNRTSKKPTGNPTPSCRRLEDLYFQRILVARKIKARRSEKEDGVEQFRSFKGGKSEIQEKAVI